MQIRISHTQQRQLADFVGDLKKKFKIVVPPKKNVKWQFQIEK